MTVAELIDYLKQFDSTLTVYVPCGGYSNRDSVQPAEIWGEVERVSFSSYVQDVLVLDGNMHR